jgi:uncharacterized ferritin-like protein (DUF455 family)
MQSAHVAPVYLPGHRDRAHLMRLDSGAILKRFFFCEQALIRGQAGWIAALRPLHAKLTIPRFIWEDALTADALRKRVFELRYPSRLMEIGEDAPVVGVFEAARHAPNGGAYMLAAARVLVPALAGAYRSYLAVADDLGDAPTRRFLDLGLREKERQIAEFEPLVDAVLASLPPEERAAAEHWSTQIAARLSIAGGLSLEAPRPAPHMPLPAGSAPFALAQIAGRESRFHQCRFYWPDAVDPSFPYGEGIALQVRSAISHLNEVWAVDTAGAILEAFAAELGWEFVVDAARWVYDESRHTQMGWTRLRDWGFADHELPLGSYIYDSARDQDPIYRLGMLFFFETKNIGKKTRRAEAFAEYGDNASQHDMEFDWADEGMHAGYGKHWITTLIAARGLPPETFDHIHERCGELVAATVASVTAEEIADIRATADRLLAHAEQIAARAAGRDLADQSVEEGT